MRQKMVAIGDEFRIGNDHRLKVFKVDGKQFLNIAVYTVATALVSLIFGL
jgi:uncharacterized protein YxjI